MSYSRYTKFKKNGGYNFVPYVKIEEQITDKHVYYNPTKNRLDLLSYTFYGDPNYGWLILQANPQYGALEYKIPTNSILRIPYPLDVAIASYENAIEEYKKYEGLES
jgi:hypothetical protein